MQRIGMRSAAIAVVCATALSVTAAQGDMIDFEDLPAGSLFGSGSSFTTGGVEITLTGAGNAEIGTAGLAAGAGNELQHFGDGLFLFDFGAAVNEMTLLYGVLGGDVSLEINGELVTVDDINDLSGVIGHVNVSVFGPDIGAGLVKVVGQINSFAIGGDQLAVDSFQYLRLPGPGALVALLAGAGIATGSRRRRPHGMR